MKIIFVSHCNFLGNSAMHLFSIANELTRRGHECAVVIPDKPETIERHGTADFAIFTYEDAVRQDFHFGSDAAPDVVHAWTPREHVKKVTLIIAANANCPYLVHMEDNEEQIVADESKVFGIDEIKTLPDDLISELVPSPYRTHVGSYQDFMARGAGFTCLMDRLLEFCPKSVPSLVFWAGFDPAFAKPLSDRDQHRARYGIAPEERVLLYAGNAHHSIVDDIRSLYAAVALLRRRGHPLRLVRTGWDHADLALGDDRENDVGEIALGFVDRSEVPVLVGMSDILVQPGRVGSFDDYRFPSKLPEYLASGHPVILPDTNIGRFLEDGINVLKLSTGDAFDIAEKIERLLLDEPLARDIGQHGRTFACEQLDWSVAVDRLEPFYAALCEAPVESASQVAAEPRDPTYPVDVVAYYLPQFHPIPENDAWWGEGFTEWTNVVRAKPMFEGHDQPRAPADLGYYDLRDPEIMHKQVALAKAHGVSAFCFYYYWFDGRRLLEKPLDYWLSAQGPDFPFCICWANEAWSRRWDGSDKEVLLPQPYNDDFAERFILDVLPILKDPRYLRVDGAPLLQIYKAVDLPDAIAAVQVWRRVAAENGVPHLHIVATQSFGISDPRPYGLDAAVEFSPPHVDRLLIAPEQAPGVFKEFEGYLEDYIGVALDSIHSPPTDYIRYRGLFPRWDNSARRQTKGHVFVNDSPKAYGEWLRFLVTEALRRRDRQKPMIFVNAWNEWAEGAYLEPDKTYGSSLLDVTRAAIHAGIVDAAFGRKADRDIAFTRKVARLPQSAVPATE